MSEIPINSRINERMDTDGSSMLFEKKSSGLYNDSESARSMVAEDNLFTQRSMSSMIQHGDNFFVDEHDPLKLLETVRKEEDELIVGKSNVRKGSSSFQHNSQRIDGLINTANDLSNAKGNGRNY